MRRIILVLPSPHTHTLPLFYPLLRAQGQTHKRLQNFRLAPSATPYIGGGAHSALCMRVKQILFSPSSSLALLHRLVGPICPHSLFGNLLSRGCKSEQLLPKCPGSRVCVVSGLCATAREITCLSPSLHTHSQSGP